MSASTQTIVVRDAARSGPAVDSTVPSVEVAKAAARCITAAMAVASNPQPRCPEGYTDVERSLWRQFTECTGADICDSGGAYGRGWERNRRACDLKAQPYATVDLDFGRDSPIVSVSSFHRLAENLCVAPAMNRRFERFNRKFDPDNAKSWLEVSEAFAEGIDPDFGCYLSYNDEYSVLGQVVQFVSFTDAKSGCEYVLLQVHGGCDVRAGYTKPVAYEISELATFVNSLQEWSASCGCQDEHTRQWMRMEMRYGELDTDGLDEWPERWAVSDKGTAKCGVCGEEVRVS